MSAVRLLTSAAAALLLAPAAPVFAGPQAPLTAERAIEVQRDGVREAVGTAPCPRDAGADDIVVCGRRGPDPNRLPLPVERVAGEPENLLPGELPRAQTSYSTCVIACPQPVKVDLLLVLKAAPKIVRHILGKDE